MTTAAPGAGHTAPTTATAAGAAGRPDGVLSVTLRAVEYWLRRYSRSWRGTAVSSLLSPVLYLAAMGVGLGTLVDRGAGAGGLGAPGYLAFIAPGLLAAAAMQVAAGEATFPVFGAIRWERTYLAMLNTPLGVGNVLAAHLVWMALRIAGAGAVHLGVMAAFGVLRSPWAVLALPAAVLTGMAFAAPVAAFSAAAERETWFNALFRFGLVPLFLFSGTFFPVDQIPDPLRPVAYVTPLWHGVALCRGFTLGTAVPDAALLHAGYLGLWAAGGAALALLAFRRRLVV
jgi:lipooligosaccharide transport system permease protein